MENKNQDPALLQKGQEQDTGFQPQFEDLTPETFTSHIEGLQNNFANEPDELRQRLDALEIKATEAIEPPQIAWLQDVAGQNPAILGTLGNFSMIIGKAKSRKSFFINIAVSAVLSEDNLLNQFRGELPEEKRKVLYFDTEQGKYHVQLALKRICRQIGITTPEDLHVYGLRKEPPTERLRIIEYAIENTEGVGFVVVDGIKDLINSINDEAEATMIASKLLKWTEEQNIHIVTVLHQNKGDNNARGHIGTELMNKAETTLSVSKNEQDKDISIVEAQYCRNREPEPFAFEIVDGLPVIAENFEIRTETKSKRYDSTEIPQHQLQSILNRVFSKGESFGYSELVNQLKLSTKKEFGKKLGTNAVKELITHCKNNDWLIQDKPKSPYKIGEFLDEVPF